MIEKTKSRMYEVEGKTVRTWNVFKGCEFDCIYCVQREQAKRQKHRCEKCYSYEPHLHAERLNEKFKAGETVFVAAAGDISFASFDQFADILEVISHYPRTTFYIQSKNPVYFTNYLEQRSSFTGYKSIYGDTNVVLCTTIETNYTFLLAHNPLISKAPSLVNRKNAMVKLDHPRKSVTIEPVLLFDVFTMVEWIKQIAPEFVYVGYTNPVGKAKKLQLPEPPLEKVKELCEELAKFTEVRLKSMRKGWDEEQE